MQIYEPFYDGNENDINIDPSYHYSENLKFQNKILNKEVGPIHSN